MLKILNEERERILKMHINATKRNYLFEAEGTEPEADVSMSQQFTKTHHEVLPNLKNQFFFIKGKTDVNSITNKNEFDEFVKGIINYLKSKNKKITGFGTIASESLIPAAKGVDRWGYAKNRLSNIRDYIKSELEKNNLIDDSNFTGFSGKYEEGKIPYDGNPNDSKYLQDQWVKVNFQLPK
jgi:hypothetical protein